MFVAASQNRRNVYALLQLALNTRLSVKKERNEKAFVADRGVQRFMFFMRTEWAVLTIKVL